MTTPVAHAAGNTDGGGPAPERPKGAVRRRRAERAGRRAGAGVPPQAALSGGGERSGPPPATDELLLGNGAIALGLLEAGVQVVTAYPGTPSTEILEEIVRLAPRLGADVYTEWSVNEKIAYDVAFAAAMVGQRAAVAMKQVGLNVAADSLFSTAYTGVVGGFVIVVCDDPGPHSSQTEQDSRLYALMAKVPVLDPATPDEARAMARAAMELSERQRVPVLLRPTLRVCHARQPQAPPDTAATPARPARFRRDPARWAATPRARLALHRRLEDVLDAVRDEERAAGAWNRVTHGTPGGPLGIVATGAAWATLADTLAEWGLDLAVLKIGMANPLPAATLREFCDAHAHVLVLEEPDAVIELQLGLRDGVLGRRSGHVPRVGELLPAIVARAVIDALATAGVATRPALDLPAAPPAEPRRPTLCPGCGHRAAFWGIRDAIPKAIFPSDIGCYTLGLNLRAVDTVIDMGAAITVASGLSHAFRHARQPPPIVATIGDSTFFHAGIPALLNAVATGCRFVLVVLDNGVVAMTGRQPTPASGRQAIADLVRACGVRFCQSFDPFDYATQRATLLAAHAHTEAPEGGVAVVIARRPCVLDQTPPEHVPVTVTEACTACGVCLQLFECPSLVADPDGFVSIDRVTCIDCGSCVVSCPHGAIVPVAGGGPGPHGPPAAAPHARPCRQARGPGVAPEATGSGMRRSRSRPVSGRGERSGPPPAADDTPAPGASAPCSA